MTVENTTDSNNLNLDPKTMTKRQRSNFFYAANKDRVLSRQKAQKAVQRQTMPWIHRANNARQTARTGGYMGTVSAQDMCAIRSLFQEAHETNRKVKMIVDKISGGLWELNNLHLVSSDEKEMA